MEAAIYTRVSKSDETQNPENQILPVRKMAEALGLTIVAEYVDQVSGATSDREAFQRMMVDAASGRFKVILIWSLDRLSREGISNTLGYIEKLRSYGVSIKSLQESWLDTRDEGLGNLLISIFAWVAQQERIRIKERTKAGLVRAKANGSVLGRPRGKKDAKPRRKSGYHIAWSKDGKRLKAQERLDAQKDDFNDK